MELDRLKASVDSDGEVDSNSIPNACTTEERDDVSHKKARLQWGSQIEFVLAIIGYTVGLGNVWRFPVLCMRNGGGAFLIPFFILMLTVGAPLYYMEVCLGQFSGRGPFFAFEFCPLFKGLGLVMIALCLLMLASVMPIMGWIFVFLYNSFAADLPWSTCGNWWNTPQCRQLLQTDFSGNMTVGQSFINITLQQNETFISSAEEFWYHYVLRKSSGLEDMGSVQLHLALSVLVAWVIVVLSVIKGVKSLGKVVYVTVLLPYILLTVLLVRGVTLDGAVDGIRLYVTPDFSKLLTVQTWREAAIQVFYSLGPAYGIVIAMASFNPFHEKRAISATAIVVFMDCFTAFYSGLVVFSVLGFMAKDSGQSVAEVARASGPGLAFVAFPEAVSRLPVPQLWSFLLFFTFLLIGVDTFYAHFEAVTCVVFDALSVGWLTDTRRALIIVGLAGLLYLLNLPFTTNGGIYLFQLFDWYYTAFSFLLAAMLEAIVVCWIYGTDRFAADIKLMTGRLTPVLIRLLWSIVVPLSLLVCFIMSVAKHSAPNYGDGYSYQPYAIVLGNCLAVSSFLPLVGYMAWKILTAKGPLIQRIVRQLKPSQRWVPHHDGEKQKYLLQDYQIPSSLMERVKLNLTGDKDTCTV